MLSDLYSAENGKAEVIDLFWYLFLAVFSILTLTSFFSSPRKCSSLGVTIGSGGWNEVGLKTVDTLGSFRPAAVAIRRLC